MVDPDRVRRLLLTLAAYREQLDGLRSLPVDQYVAGHRYAGRYLVQAAAQTCIDVANHVIASEGWRPPGSFAETFTVLVGHGVIEPPLAERLRGLAGLRNRLVRLYDDVDDDLVHQALQGGLDDLEAFAKAITALLVR